MIPRAVLVALMIIMLIDMMLGVFFRYVVGQALAWSEEVGTLQPHLAHLYRRGDWNHSKLPFLHPPPARKAGGPPAADAPGGDRLTDHDLRLGPRSLWAWR